MCSLLPPNFTENFIKHYASFYYQTLVLNFVDGDAERMLPMMSRSCGIVIQLHVLVMYL